jgi:hypothetical protein
MFGQNVMFAWQPVCNPSGQHTHFNQMITFVNNHFSLNAGEENFWKIQ